MNEGQLLIQKEKLKQLSNEIEKLQKELKDSRIITQTYNTYFADLIKNKEENILKKCNNNKKNVINYLKKYMPKIQIKYYNQYLSVDTKKDIENEINDIFDKLNECLEIPEPRKERTTSNDSLEVVGLDVLGLE